MTIVASCENRSDILMPYDRMAACTNGAPTKPQISGHPNKIMPAISGDNKGRVESVTRLFIFATGALFGSSYTVCEKRTIFGRY